MPLYMPLFRACSTLRVLTQLHGHLTVTGLHNDPLASTKLIESYAILGPLESSRLVFETFKNPDSFMWGVLIKTHVWSGWFEEAISLYNRLLAEERRMSYGFIFPSVLKACTAISDSVCGQIVHGRIVKCGMEGDPVLQTSLMNMYGEMGCLRSAWKIFDEMPTRDVVSWSSIICSYVQNGHPTEGLDIFREMVMANHEVDPVTLLPVTEACGALKFLGLAKSVHCYALRRVLQLKGALSNSLIAMYGKCDQLHSAERIFNAAADKTPCTWTAMISCYNQNAYNQEALRTFITMQSSKVEPNAVTLISVLCSCARLGYLHQGKSVHGFIIRTAVEQCSDLRSALVDFYANCGRLRECHSVFDQSQDRHIVSWNMLISGNAQQGNSEEALELFIKMLDKGIATDSFTLASVASACGAIGFSQLGCQIHSHVVKTGFSNEFVRNSLIDMYSKCGCVDSAYKIFEDNENRSVATWNCMIGGYNHNGKYAEAISLFDTMFSLLIEMDEVTLLLSVQACSGLGYLDMGKWIHHKLTTYGIRNNLYIDTALVDMYAKCGDLQTARKIFDGMSERSKVSWSAMIGAYSVHGRIDAAMSLFSNMIEAGMRPNEVIFMNILSACSHAGYLEQGKSYFYMMTTDFGIEPKPEHLACLVDLLSRGGDLDGAYILIKSMPFPVHASIWSSLINGCRIHQRMDVLSNIQENLVNMQTDDTGYYTLLSQVYAEGGEWNRSKKVQSKMKSLSLRKAHGCSVIETDREVNLGM